MLRYIILLGVLESAKSACSNNYVPVGSICCSWINFVTDLGYTTEAKEYNLVGARQGALQKCEAEGSEPASMETRADYIMTSSCAYGLAPRNVPNGLSTTQSFWVGLDDIGSPLFWRWRVSGNALNVNSMQTDGFINPSNMPPLNGDTAFIVNGRLDVASDRSVPAGMTGFVCSQPNSETFNRTLPGTCNCPAGWYRIGTECLKAVYFADGAVDTRRSWFEGRMECKKLHAQADMLEPINWYLQQAVNLYLAKYNGSNSEKLMWVSWTDYAKETDIMTNANTDLPMPNLIPISNGDSEHNDFIAAGDMKQKVLTYFGADNVGASLVLGVVCSIKLDTTSSECKKAGVFTPFTPVMAPAGIGLLRIYMFRQENSNGELISGISTALQCKEYILNPANRNGTIASAGATVWNRNHKQCYALTDTSQIKNEVKNPELMSAEYTIFQHINETTCIPQYQKLVGWGMSKGTMLENTFASYSSVDACFAACRQKRSCSGVTFCGGENKCEMWSEGISDHDQRNLDSGSFAFKKYPNCIVQRMVPCKVADLSPSPTVPLCPSTWRYMKDNTVVSPRYGRCVKTVLGSFPSFGQAYKKCVEAASAVGKVGFPAAVYSSNTTLYSPMWSGATKLWLGVFKTQSGWVDFNNYTVTFQGSDTTSGTEKYYVKSNAALSFEGNTLTGCSDCNGVFCELFDLNHAKLKL